MNKLGLLSVAALGVLLLAVGNEAGATGAPVKEPETFPAAKKGEQWLLRYSFSAPLSPENRRGFDEGVRVYSGHAGHTVQALSFTSPQTAEAVITYGAPSELKVGQSVSLGAGMSVTLEDAQRMG